MNSASSTGQGQGERPNILMLCTDQQRFSALSCYGNEEVQTPNIDRLARSGVLFENCYVQNPVCAPSRATLMTGKYVSSHGLHANGVDLPAQELFTGRLAHSGYDCGLVGKLHLGACQNGRSEPRLDDGFRVFRWAHDPYRGSSENGYHRWLKSKHPELYDAAMDQKNSETTWDTMPTQAHFSHWIGDETIDFLRSSRQMDRPFFFVANFFDPHHGFGAPAEYVDRYDPGSLSRPVTKARELESAPTILTEASHESYAGHARGFTEYSDQELQDVKAAYYAMVTLVDDEVGRILAALDEEGLADNTLVVFTSDHGEMLGDHQLMLKGPFMYDCAVRVPLILRWPGHIPAASRRGELVQWVDLAPTFLEVAGEVVPEWYQGESLVRLWSGDSDGWRDWALCQYRDSGHSYSPQVHVTMLRQDRWKLIVHHGAPVTDRERSGQLFDLVADPQELDNLWNDPGHRNQRAQLYELLVDVLVAGEDRSSRRLSDW